MTETPDIRFRRWLDGPTGRELDDLADVDLLTVGDLRWFLGACDNDTRAVGHLLQAVTELAAEHGYLEDPEHDDLRRAANTAWLRFETRLKDLRVRDQAAAKEGN